ncbi:response regulator transcription factor [Paenibacillus forsythiae]|uniref:response regulator transcription factor n=1 Tax=Paenibacillus forsythiae TaxID=365616 RepID=UPI0018DC82DE|nr:response regulator transcription factor [Paenibacillus forsythiae]
MNVVIADDQVIVREGLKMILSLHEEIHILGEAKNGRELLQLLDHAVPDVILMDIRMPEMDGIEATLAVKQRYAAIKVIILTTFNEDEYIFEGLKNGADGYILKDSGSREIMNAIKTVWEGGVLLNPKVAAKMAEAFQGKRKEGPETENKLHLLTPRELETARYLLSGKSNKAIGEALFVTEGTVKNYMSRILEKLELGNRTELILYLSKLDRI